MNLNRGHIAQTLVGLLLVVEGRHQVLGVDETHQCEVEGALLSRVQ